MIVYQVMNGNEVVGVILHNRVPLPSPLTIGAPVLINGDGLPGPAAGMIPHIDAIAQRAKDAALATFN